MPRPFAGVLFTALFIAVQFFGISFPLAAQNLPPPPDVDTAVSEAETLPDPLTDETAILLGEATDIPEPAGGSSILVVLRMVLVLAVAALAIYGVVFFVKRLARPGESRDPNLKVLARVPLSGDSFAAVISVGARAWLVGGGSGSVNLISEIDDPESLETMLIEDAKRSADADRKFPDFRSFFWKLGGASGGGQADNPGGSHAENLRRQRERLKGQ